MGWTLSLQHFGIHTYIHILISLIIVLPSKPLSRTLNWSIPPGRYFSKRKPMVFLENVKEEEQCYQLLTSTRYDPFLATLSWNNDHNGPCSFFLLPYHFDRLTSAAKTHKWDHTMLSYDYLKSTCLDAISKERQQNGAAFRVNVFCFFSFVIFEKKNRFELHFHKMVKSSCLQPL